MADEGNTTRQASADGESGVHRLRDIVVEEVSLVDRAANKRRFLVVKRSSEMADGKSEDRGKPQQGPAGAAQRGPGKKTKPKPDEDVDKARSRTTRAASDEEDEDEEETEKARRSRSSQDEDDEEEDDEVGSAKAGSTEEDEEDDEDDEEDDETNATKTRTRAKAEGDESDLALPPAMKTAVLRVLAQALERLMAVATQVKDADASDDETDPSVPDSLTGELEDVGELLEEVGEQLADPAIKADGKKSVAAKGRAAKAAVSKAGRRMAKDRLDRFQKALEALSSILKELTAERKPPAPAAGAAKKSLAKGDAAPGMTELAASVRELTRVVKRQEEELVRMQKTRATSNAIPVEGGSRRRETPDVSWPLDMNRPISRDTISKSVSFYDDQQ